MDEQRRTEDLVRQAAEDEGVDPDDVVEVRYGPTGRTTVHAGGKQDPQARQQAIERAGTRLDGSPESVLKSHPTAHGNRPRPRGR